MQNLFPIIRRKRRPLVVTDAPPVAVGDVELVSPSATEPNRTKATNGTQDETRTDDAQTTSERESR